MEFEQTTMAQLNEIERLISNGLTDRRISRALKIRRTTIAAVRRGELTVEALNRLKSPVDQLPPSWTMRVDWLGVERDLSDGHDQKRIWEDYAKDIISNSQFYKTVQKKFKRLLEKTVTLREFNAGEHCEVDYAGTKIEWVDIRTGEVHYAHVFVGILCFSQLLFAVAAEDEKKNNWLHSHRLMYEFFGGVPCVTVPDNLKTGVTKAHRYDPDLNPDYHELAKHYVTSIVPARVRSPKDKALVEGAVKIIMRYFRFVNRRRTFTSIAEINRALRDAYDKINSREHTRFKVSRKDRFLALEKASLRPLPLEPFSVGEWKLAKIHPDCTIQSDHNFYSAPHIHRSKEVRVKTSETQVEIFLDLERIAVHSKALGKVGVRVTDKTHLPENSRAYLEATPSHILQQAQFINATLHCFIDGLFKSDTLGNIRKAQGFVRVAHSTIKNNGRELGSYWIERSIVYMSLFNRTRVAVFETLLKNEFKKYKQLPTTTDRSITRKPGNPTLRGSESAEVSGVTQPNSQQPLPMEVINQ